MKLPFVNFVKLYNNGFLNVPYHHKIQDVSSIAERFVKDNYDIPTITDQMVNLHVIEKTDQDGRLTIMIEVKENTTYDNLVNAIPVALQWRDRLNEWQGGYSELWLETVESFKNMLIESFNDGVSYSKLANMINEDVLNSLILLEKFQEKYLEKKPDIQGTFYDNLRELPEPSFENLSRHPKSTWSAWLDIIANQFQEDRYVFVAMSRAYFELKALGMRDEKIEEIFHEGLVSLIEGIQPFVKDYPISGEMVRYRIRYWRKKYR